MRTLWLLLALLLAPSAWAQQNPYPAPSTQFTGVVTGTVATSALVVPGISGQRVYATFWMTTPTTGAVVTWFAGSNTQCKPDVTLTTSLTFATPTPQAFAAGAGIAPILVTPAGDSLCVGIATQAAPGYIGYAQF